MGVNHAAFLVLVIAKYLDCFNVVAGNEGVSKLKLVQDNPLNGVFTVLNDHQTPALPLGMHCDDVSRLCL